MEGVLAIIGVVLALIVPLTIEYMRRPQLRVERADDLNADDYRIAHVRVVNEPLRGWRAKLLLRNDATGCAVEIAFSSRSDGTITRLPGRWSSAPEPLALAPGGYQFDPTRSPDSLRVTITPGPLGETLGVAIKYDGEPDAFGFSWQNYNPCNGEGLRSEIHRLRDAAYEVVVRAQAGEIRAERRFVLANRGSHARDLELRPAP